MALVLTAMLPVVALVVASAVNQRTQARRIVGAEAARVARLAALREADLIDGGRNVLTTIVQQAPIRSFTTEACSARLAELLPLYPRFANMGVVDRAGNLVCSAIKPAEPLNFADRPWFQRAVSTHAFALGDYQVGRITGRPSLVFGLPILDPEAVVSGVVWAALDLSWLQQFAAQVKLPGKPAVVLMDRQGTVLAREPDPDRWVGTRVRNIAEIIRRGDSAPLESLGIDGVDRVYANVLLGDRTDPHAIVGVGIATSGAYRDANRALQRNLVVLAIICALGIGAARLLANRFILDPTHSLVAVAQRLAAGDLTARVGPPYPPGEIGLAGEAFDAMAVSLESRDMALMRAADVQRKSESRFKALLEAAPDATIGVDRVGTIKLVNRRAEVLFGAERKELLGAGIQALCPDLPVELIGRPDRPASALRRGPVDVTAVRRDGSKFPAEVTLSALDTDEGPLVSIAVRDVTERKEAEDAVARIAHQLQEIIDNAPALISMQDTEGRYILVNRQFETVRGIDRSAATGRLPTDLFGPEVGEEIRLRDLEPVVTGAAVEGEEVIFVDGEPHWFLGLRFPLHDSTGRLYAVCAILTDVTERIQAESQRQALAAQLQQSQRLESLGQLAGGIAHDFNNLLGVILNYADFILDAVEAAPGDVEPLFASVQADTQAIFQAAQTGAALTRQLLIFGRRDPVQPRLLNLDEVVRGLEPLLRRTIGEDVDLRLSLDSHSALVRADPGRLEQVLLNVAVNARDAMPSGGRLMIATSVVDLDDATALEAGVEPGRWVRLAMSDTGVGMSHSVAARAFEPFFTTKPKGHGTGLGLATVFGVVRDAGGQVAINSSPGEGTTLLIHLPAAEGRVAAEGDKTANGARGGHGQTVLVVEDDDVMREVARRILARDGYAVITAADATEALRICEDTAVDIDLVLSDVVMPGLSGPDLVARLRTVRPDVRSIYMSGYPEDFVARRHPGDDVTVIRKPFTPGVLLRQIRRALDEP
ncbi:MAG: PAS domain S-box protein [Actinomycetota bacterium]|jgi:PAS domain S-box-containing protein